MSFGRMQRSTPVSASDPLCFANCHANTRNTNTRNSNTINANTRNTNEGIGALVECDDQLLCLLVILFVLQIAPDHFHPSLALTVPQIQMQMKMKIQIET